MTPAQVQPRILIQSGFDELAHLGAVAGEAHQRPDGETELQAQRDLAGDEQFRGLALAEETDDAHGGHDGDGAGDQPPQPGAQPDVQKSFHHDLAGERAGERGVLAGSQQRHGEQGAGDAHAQSGAEQLVGVLDFRHVLMARPVKGGGGEDREWRR